MSLDIGPLAGTPLGEFYRKRVRQNRDLLALITDRNLERGTGKTTLALVLAHYFDRTDDGLTPDKGYIQPEPLNAAYTDKPLGSALVLDEAEAAASNRRSMSNVNEAIRMLISQGRVEQKYTLMTSPGGHMVDRDIRALADIWILVERRGKATVYRMKYNPHGDHPLTEKIQTLSWGPIGQYPAEVGEMHRALTDLKRRRLRGEMGGDEYVPADEVSDQVRQARKKAERETRDTLIRQYYSNLDVTQEELAKPAGLSRSRIGDIVSSAD